MKRIFVDGEPLIGKNPSGIAKLEYEMVQAISNLKTENQGYSITVFIPSRKRNFFKKWQFEGVQLKVLPLPLKIINGLYKRGLLPPIDFLLGKGIYVFFNYRRLPISSKSRSITYIHDVAYKIHPETIEPANLQYLNKIIPNTLKDSTKLITISQTSRKELLKYFPGINEKKLKVIYPGINIKKYSEFKNNGKLPLKELEERKYVLFVGNLEPRKNIAYLIEIYKEIIKKEEYKDFKLLLIGSGGWNNESLTRNIEEINKQGGSIIRPHSRIDDEYLPILYNKAYAVVQPSLHEGFGMPVLESLAANANVCVSDIDVFKEVDKYNVLTYFSLNNPIEAADIIINSRPASKDKVHKTLQSYSWRNSANELLTLIKSLK